MRDLKVEYEVITSVEFKVTNGVTVKIKANKDNSVSVIHDCPSITGILAEYNKYDLQEYINFLQTFHDQMI